VLQLKNKSELPRTSILQPTSALKSGIFDWPTKQFSPSNCVKSMFGTTPVMSLKAYNAAVDFQLNSTDGTLVSLGDLLSTKPVFIAAGQTTCPVFQGNAKSMEKLARDFGKSVHFLLVNSLQPHPKVPDRSPATGRVWQMQYSDIYQPKTPEERMTDAVKVKSLLPSWTVVADAMETQLMNPFYSTYGPSVQQAWLVDTSGMIAGSQLWFNYTISVEQLEWLLSPTVDGVP